MDDYVVTWFGQPIESLSRKELIDAINYLAKELSEYRTPENIHALAVGKAKVLVDGWKTCR